MMLQTKLIIVAIGSIAVALSAFIANIRSKAVTEYKSRVESTERKIDAKAQMRKRAAASDADRVLKRYYRD